MSVSLEKVKTFFNRMFFAFASPAGIILGAVAILLPEWRFLGVILFLIGVVMLPRCYKEFKDFNKEDHSKNLVDVNKRNAIDEIYNCIRDEIEPLHDLGNKLSGHSWKKYVMSIGKDEFIKQLHDYKLTMSAAIIRLAEMIEKYDNFKECDEFRKSHFGFQNDFFTPVSEFQINLRKLPEAFSIETLDLLDVYADSFQNARGVFTSWARDSMKYFKEIRHNM